MLSLRQRALAGRQREDGNVAASFCQRAWHAAWALASEDAAWRSGDNARAGLASVGRDLSHHRRGLAG